MDKDEKAMEVLKKLWGKEKDCDDASVFHKYLDRFDKSILLESAKRFGTPQYILNEDELRERARFFRQTFKKHIPQIDCFYAFKCNDLPHIIKTLKEEGFYADVAGIFELQLALKIGFEKIIFTGPGKTNDELQTVIDNADKVTLNIDNVDELLNLQGLGIKDPVSVSLRLNPDSAVTKTWSKFGIELPGLKEVIETINNDPKLKLVGLHFHCSWNRTPERYLENIRLVGEFLKKNFSKEEFSSLEFFDIGGGFYPEDCAMMNKDSPKGMLIEVVKEHAEDSSMDFSGFDPHAFAIDKVDSLEDFAKSISAQLEKYIFSINPDIRVYCEPGRFIVLHSTSILTKVIAKKGECIIADAGINMVGDYRFKEYSFAPIMNLSDFSHSMIKKTLYGSLCDPSDLWGYSCYAKDIKKGDVLAILHQGAYTFSCAWRFIKPTAPYVVIKGKSLELAKKAEKLEDRYTGCSI